MPALTFADAKAKMAEIRSSFQRDVESIRASSIYNDAGRRQEIAKTFFSHRKQVEGLRSKFTTTNDESRVKLSARLFGLPGASDAASVLVYRDACDRAAKLEDENAAAAMLKRATEMGDQLLARAVAGHAHHKRWNSVTSDYAESTGLSTDLEELEALPSGGMLNLGLSALFGLRTPDELQSLSRNELSDERLKQIADGQ